LNYGHNYRISATQLTLYSSDYIVYEVITTIWGYSKRKDLVENSYKILTNQKFISIIQTEIEDMGKSSA